MSSIIKASNIDLTKLTFSDVKVDKYGRKMVFVNYDGGKVLIQTPKMYIPNGIKRWRKKDAVDNKEDAFEIEMSFGGADKEDKNSMEIKKFHEKMQEFDELVKTHIQTHSKEWLSKNKISMESIEEAFYAPTVKVATDKDGNVLEYPSRIRTKLDRERIGDDSFTGRFLSNKQSKTPVMMFNEKKEELDLNEDTYETVVSKGSQMTGLLELVYLSITTKVSPKWKMIQGKVSNNKKLITGYAMIDDDLPEDLETEDIETQLEHTHLTPDHEEHEEPEEPVEEEHLEVEQEVKEPESKVEEDGDDLEPPVKAKKTRSKK